MRRDKVSPIGAVHDVLRLQSRVLESPTRVATDLKIEEPEQGCVTESQRLQR